eukprot:NODE_4149_length_359_cov_223.158065_g3565_i0.p1 GENE.NODE_4149_length_359_cov_223.158065_g3565_i0~~NODE_4149_length_359_cov_223.158065_g3565_i0.p1  ORF type:complete len:82 (-),score=8.66 NODE_4149_length_359_cov_223.158065_g3565_i0:66-311(-)
MLSAALPYHSLRLHGPALMFHIGRARSPPPFPEKISHLCDAFLSRCFIINPDDRPACAQLVGDAFVTSAGTPEPSSVLETV